MENQETKNTKEHKRSASYPGKSLEKSIAFVTQLYTNFSSTTSIKREEWATIAKVHPNSVARDFAAANQYGLLDKTTDGYKVSQLFEDIHKPENQAQKRVKQLIAFGSPKLYQVLIEKFDGHIIPNEFPNTLVKHHSIIESAAEEAADIFIETAQFVGALNDNKVLRYKDTLGAQQKTQYAEIYEETDKEKDKEGVKQDIQIISPDHQSPLSNLADTYKKVPIYLTNEKVAYFAYPSNISEKDIKLIDHSVQGILLRIQLDNEENKNPA